MAELIKKRLNAEVAFLFFISAITYLPYVTRLTYYLDDWYYIYDGLVAGANIFHPMFSIDRPLRGYFFDIYFSVLGASPFFYHLFAYIWRLFAGIATLWLCNILWSQNRRFNFFIALLVILYPGYFWWVSAIEYQPMIVSLALQVFSVVLSLKVIQTSNWPEKVVYLIGGILTGWAYIALVDYALGMEVFRFICIYLVVQRNSPSTKIVEKILNTVKAWSWNILIPFGFVFWRTFIFENHRQATDMALQLNKFSSSPFQKWIINLYYSVANVGFYAWIRQFYIRFAGAGFKVSPIGLVSGFGGVVLLLILENKFRKNTLGNNLTSQKNLQEAGFLGLVSLFFGVLPIVIANRFVNLSFYSHYGLPSSLASAILLASLIFYFSPREYVSSFLFYIIVVIAIFTHSLIADKTMVLENSVKAFWWQASWRIPQLRPGTTLITLYPYAEVADDDFGLPQAVNLIYFPESRSGIPVRYLVSTLLPTNKNIEFVLMPHAHKKTEKYRTHDMIIDYGNVLVLSQPTPESCVRVIDGTQYIPSRLDSENVKLVAPYSKIENVRVYQDFETPPEFAFGPEPLHDWCFYFEKADLAVQRFDWKEAGKLGDDALMLKLHPLDQTEWFPILQAYSVLNNKGKVKLLSAKINDNKFLREQLCIIFSQKDFKVSLSVDMKLLVVDLFCK